MRLRPLTEAECYARCYGHRGGQRIHILRPSPARQDALTGERLREAFEQRLDVRDPDHDAEAA